MLVVVACPVNNTKDSSIHNHQVLTDSECSSSLFTYVYLSISQRKMLAVLLFHSFMIRQGMSITGATQESGSITGKTVRTYRKEFYENKGKFKETKQGKYK